MRPTQEQLHDILMSLVTPGHEAAAEAVVSTGLTKLESGKMEAVDIDQAVMEMAPLVGRDNVGKVERLAVDVKHGLKVNPGEPGMHYALMSIVEPGKEADAEAIVGPGVAQLASGAMTPAEVDQAVAQMKPLVVPAKVAVLERIAADVKARMA